MKTNFPLLVANGLKKHCSEWKYPWLEQLKEKNTAEHFYKLFCKITKTYFISDQTDYYHVEFSKDGTVTIKKCGPDYGKRNFDAVLNIQSILPLLVESECKDMNHAALSSEDAEIKEVSHARTCPVCGNNYITSDEKQKYCSVSCELWADLI